MSLSPKEFDDLVSILERNTGLSKEICKSGAKSMIRTTQLLIDDRPELRMVLDEGRITLDDVMLLIGAHVYTEHITGRTIPMFKSKTI